LLRERSELLIIQRIKELFGDNIFKNLCNIFEEIIVTSEKKEYKNEKQKNIFNVFT